MAARLFPPRHWDGLLKSAPNRWEHLTYGYNLNQVLFRMSVSAIITGTFPCSISSRRHLIGSLRLKRNIQRRYPRVPIDMVFRKCLERVKREYPKKGDPKWWRQRWLQNEILNKEYEQVTMVVKYLKQRTLWNHRVRSAVELVFQHYRLCHTCRTTTIFPSSDLLSSSALSK